MNREQLTDGPTDDRTYFSLNSIETLWEIPLVQKVLRGGHLSEKVLPLVCKDLRM